jgi:hypothetical protein
MAKKPVRNHEVLVWKRNKKGVRRVVKNGRTKFTKAKATAIVANLRKKGRHAKIRKIVNPKTANDKLIKKWLRGDLDFDRTLMVKLAKAARDSNTVLRVNFGKRTFAEQTVLWNRYLNGTGNLAARPGTSRHETGKAADVVTNRTHTSVGNVKKIREALKKHGLCLPVSGEPWHTEIGNTFRA